MAFIIVVYDDGWAHVVPDHDGDPDVFERRHVLTETCWCEPVVPPESPNVMSHRDELERRVGR